MEQVINCLYTTVLVNRPSLSNITKKLTLKKRNFFFKVSLFFNLFILFYLLLSVLGLCCCARAFSSCSERGLLFVAVRRLLIVVASLVEEHRLQACGLQQLWHAGFSSCGSRALEHRLSSCGSRAQLLCSMWDLPGPGLEPVSPELAGRFLTTAPPGKSLKTETFGGRAQIGMDFQKFKKRVNLPVCSIM